MTEAEPRPRPEPAPDPDVAAVAPAMGLAAGVLRRPGDGIRLMWRHFTDPQLAPHERLFFEIYAQALQGRPGTTGLLDDVVDAWIEPVAAYGIKRGVPAEAARADARLGLAVIRGLLLDLLATDNRSAVDAALERYIAQYEALFTSTERPA